MFGIDTYTFGTVWPSIALVVVMIAALAWGAVKVRKLIKEDGEK